MLKIFIEFGKQIFILDRNTPELIATGSIIGI
jgi:hypothetical protein